MSMPAESIIICNGSRSEQVNKSAVDAAKQVKYIHKLSVVSLPVSC